MQLLTLGGFAFLALHPFTTYPLSLLALPKEPLNCEPGKTPRIALLFCCHNEEKTIRAKLKNLKALLARYPNLTVHVYLDACTDKTASILEKAGKGIRVLQGRERRGKNFGLNTLMKSVHADIVAFNDANVIIDPAAFDLVTRYFTDKTVGCVCAKLLYMNDNDSSTAKTGGLYWRFEEWLKAAESARDSTVAVDGSLFFIRRALWRELPAEVPNDFFSSMDILTDGHRVVSAQDVLCYEKSATSRADEFRRKVRITTRAMTTHLMLRRRLRRMSIKPQYFYLSHKLIRWFTFYWLMATGIGALLWLATHGFAALAAGLAVATATFCWLGLKQAHGLAAQVVDALFAFAATAWGATRALAGRRVSTWTIPGSSR